ncbi:hypothetical protein ANCDUO_11511 [Ancylostoma duodenale]|uniref:Uncharacterized protein n=1 Tax=Ancylostoma duodenale TaxID=51022 RepID=A0A0C2GBB0_9BILA|nr:hypothetical protein ANCDUO_11511 [Ancylostoma duodenale]
MLQHKRNLLLWRLVMLLATMTTTVKPSFRDCSPRRGLDII